MTKAFVAGATGLTGREVVRALRARGVDVHAHVRPDSRALDEWRQRFGAMGAEVDTTPWDEAAMTKRLTSLAPTHVFALLGTTQKRGRAAKSGGKDETYETVDYGLSALLLRAATACGSHPRFVYLSSMGVNASTKNPYLAVRHRLETELRQSGLPWFAARPSFIVGDRDEARPMEKVGSVVGDGLLALAGALGAKKLRESYRSQTGEELAASLVKLALDERPDRVVTSDELRALIH
ncbi:MAG: NAD(P)H-binding protein [Sandaracinus sp.]|nr:NAD(P)H-binding protein [Sandaracinus sp.]MCB9621015.1 NAD(P)H-binding protein [Sandaracinus sp.]MCB9635917.1 NAD(P)H-binding protein [Sandaracinus sp.]